MQFVKLQNECKIGKIKYDSCYLNEFLYTCRYFSGALSKIVRLVEIWCSCNKLWNSQNNFFSKIMNGLEALRAKIRLTTINLNCHLLMCEAICHGAVCVCLKTQLFVNMHREACWCIQQFCVNKLCRHFVNETVACENFSTIKNTPQKNWPFTKKQFWSEI